MSLTLEKFDVACSLVTYGRRYGLMFISSTLRNQSQLMSHPSFAFAIKKTPNLSNNNNNNNNNLTLF